LPERQLKRTNAPGLSSLGVANVESVGLGRGRFGAEMEALFVLVTDGRGLGDEHTDRHTCYREPRYD